MQVCQEALHHTALNGMILSRLANLYLRTGNLKEAISYYQQAEQQNPLDVEGQLNLGIICMQTHDIPCARTAFRAFVANAPKNYGPELGQAKAALARMGNGPL